MSILVRNPEDGRTTSYSALGPFLLWMGAISLGHRGAIKRTSARWVLAEILHRTARDDGATKTRFHLPDTLPALELAIEPCNSDLAGRKIDMAFEQAVENG